MAVTFTNLVGARENLDKTIADLLSDNWTASNITGTITPYFANDTDEPDQLARPDGSFVDEVRVNYSNRLKYDGEFEVNGDESITRIEADTIAVRCQWQITSVRAWNSVRVSVKPDTSGFHGVDSDLVFHNRDNTIIFSWSAEPSPNLSLGAKLWDCI